MGNFEAAVELCLCENKMAEAILLAIAGGPELLQRTQKRYFAKNNGNISRVSRWRQLLVKVKFRQMQVLI